MWGCHCCQNNDGAVWELLRLFDDRQGKKSVRSEKATLAGVFFSLFLSLSGLVFRFHPHAHTDFGPYKELPDQPDMLKLHEHKHIPCLSEAVAKDVHGWVLGKTRAAIKAAGVIPRTTITQWDSGTWNTGAVVVCVADRNHSI